MLRKRFKLGALYALSLIVATVLLIALDRLALIYSYSVIALTPFFVLIGAFMIASSIKIYVRAKLIDILYKGRPRCLIIDGIYSRTRNPRYCSILLISSGLLLINSNIILFFLIPLYYVLLSLIIIHREESAHEKTFDREWLLYKKSVNRLIPFRVCLSK